MKNKWIHIFIVSTLIILFIMMFSKIHKLELEVANFTESIKSVQVDSQFNLNQDDLTKIEEMIHVLEINIDDLEGQIKVSTTLRELVSDKYSNEEFIFLLDVLSEYEENDYNYHLESLKKYVRVLRETLKYNGAINIIYASELMDTMESKTKLRIREYNTEEEIVINISEECEFFLGGEYYIHKTTLNDLLIPGEPLETDIFTLIIIEDEIRYVFSGRSY